MQHSADVYVCKRIRHRRWVNETTQKQLGDAIGIKFQQIQKYAARTKHVSASHIRDIENVLGVRAFCFFKGYDAHPDTGAHGSIAQGEIKTDKETLELLRAYYAIPKHQRQRLLNLVRALSEG